MQQPDIATARIDGLQSTQKEKRVITSHSHCQHCSASFIQKTASQKFCCAWCKNQANKFALVVSVLHNNFATIKEAAETLSLSPSAIRSKIKRGELVSYQLLGRLFVRRDQLNGKEIANEQA